MISSCGPVRVLLRFVDANLSYLPHLPKDFVIFLLLFPSSLALLLFILFLVFLTLYLFFSVPCRSFTCRYDSVFVSCVRSCNAGLMLTSCSRRARGGELLPNGCCPQYLSRNLLSRPS